MLLSSRPWSWSTVVSRPNLPVLVLVLNCPVLVLTTGLGLAFKQDQDLINFYCAISATKLWLLYITETHCPRFDMMHAFSTSCTCSHGTVFVYTSDICAGWKRVQPRWPFMRPHCARLGESVLSHIVFLKALALLECDCIDIGHCTNWAVDVASDSTL